LLDKKSPIFHEVFTVKSPLAISSAFVLVVFKDEKSLIQDSQEFSQIIFQLIFHRETSKSISVILEIFPVSSIQNRGMICVSPCCKTPEYSSTLLSKTNDTSASFLVFHKI